MVEAVALVAQRGPRPEALGLQTVHFSQDAVLHDPFSIQVPNARFIRLSGIMIAAARAC
jgi:hypothetical protein